MRPSGKRNLGIWTLSVTLDSYIVSNTPSHEMKLLWSIGKKAMQQRHIVFQEEDAATYIRTMLPR